MVIQMKQSNTRGTRAKGRHMAQFFVFVLVLPVLSLFAPTNAFADDEGRYRIVNIMRDVGDTKNTQVVNGTMMVDSETGRTWILDEERGRWIPVGFRAPNLTSDVTLTPKQ